MNAIFHSNKKRPVTLNIIKAVLIETRELYAPVIRLLRDVNLDPIVVKEAQLKKENTEADLSVIMKRNNRLCADSEFLCKC